MNEMDKLLTLLADVNEDIDFANEKRLIDDGLVDSFDLTVLIAALDEAYDIHIDAAEIEPENFNSVEAMLRLIESYQHNS